MSEQIIFRELLEQDYKPLEDIIRETWEYDKFCSPKVAAKLAKAYLASCLANQTFIRIAADKDTPVGIIMGKNIREHKCPLKFRLRLFSSALSLLTSKEGRSASKIFQNVDTVDGELLNSSSNGYQGEVAFFAINPRYRGQGLGKELFHSLLSYMNKENIPNFYLFTDTSCNYQFYEHQGMTRRCRKNLTLDLGIQKNEMSFFLYDYNRQTVSV